MTDKKTKAEPYERSSFTKSDYNTVNYEKPAYGEMKYVQANYVGADYKPGSTMKETLIGKINCKDAVVSVIGQ